MKYKHDMHVLPKNIYFSIILYNILNQNNSLIIAYNVLLLKCHINICLLFNSLGIIYFDCINYVKTNLDITIWKEVIKLTQKKLKSSFKQRLKNEFILLQQQKSGKIELQKS